MRLKVERRSDRPCGKNTSRIGQKRRRVADERQPSRRSRHSDSYRFDGILKGVRGSVAAVVGCESLDAGDRRRVLFYGGKGAGTFRKRFGE
jgi:chromosomal replication initiation ATPase DnaA